MSVDPVVLLDGKWLKLSDLPGETLGTTDPIVFHLGVPKPLSVAGGVYEDHDGVVVDDTNPERVRLFSRTDEAGSPPPPPPPPPATTWNPADHHPNLITSGGDLTLSDDNTIFAYKTGRATTSRDSGTWSWTGTLGTQLNTNGLGFSLGGALPVLVGFDNPNSIGVLSNGNVYFNGSVVGSVGSTFTTGDAIKCTRNTDGTFKFQKNADTPSADIAGPTGAVFPAASMADPSPITGNFTEWDAP